MTPIIPELRDAKGQVVRMAAAIRLVPLPPKRLTEMQDHLLQMAADGIASRKRAARRRSIKRTA